MGVQKENKRRIFSAPPAPASVSLPDPRAAGKVEGPRPQPFYPKGALPLRDVGKEGSPKVTQNGWLVSEVTLGQPGSEVRTGTPLPLRFMLALRDS